MLPLDFSAALSKLAADPNPTAILEALLAVLVGAYAGWIALAGTWTATKNTTRAVAATWRATGRRLSAVCAWWRKPSRADIAIRQLHEMLDAQRDTNRQIMDAVREGRVAAWIQNEPLADRDPTQPVSESVPEPDTTTLTVPVTVTATVDVPHDSDRPRYAGYYGASQESAPESAGHDCGKKGCRGPTDRWFHQDGASQESPPVAANSCSCGDPDCYSNRHARKG